ncbi:MAG: translation initiation factor IF-2 [Vicinamibacteria bacterium]
MPKPRVYELARELGLSSQEIIEKLKAMGIEAKAPSSSVDEDQATKFKRHVRLESQSSKRNRVYGSEEDEGERDAIEKERAAKVAAERAEREQAAREAEKERATRKAGTRTKAAAAPAPAAPAVRLAPRVAVKPSEPAPEPPAAEAPVAKAAVPAPEAAVVPAPPREEPVLQRAPITMAPIGRSRKAAAAEAEPVAAASVALPAEPAPEQVRSGEAEASGGMDDVIEDGVPAVGPSAAPVRMTPRIAPLRPIGRPAAAAKAGVAAAPEGAAPGEIAEPQAPIVVKPIAPVIRAIRPIASPSRTTGQHRVATRPGAPPQRPGLRGGTPGVRGAQSPTPGGAAGRPGSPASPTSQPSSPAGRPGAYRPGIGARRQPREKGAREITPIVTQERPKWTGPLRPITITEGVTVKELSERMPDAKNRDILKYLIGKGLMLTVNQTLDIEIAQDVCREFGYDAAVRSYEEEVVQEQSEVTTATESVPRAPVVTVMGHVDHGKTSLLDAIRETRVAEREHGGITQHIGAYKIDVGARAVVFLDTPGHEAFTLMRSRGARVTDIVVLVVAADDGVMPQTLEALDHAKAAGVPIVVAVNKIDKAEAQPDRIRQQLADRGLLPEEWGGQTVFVNVSAKKKQNLDQLLEMILLQADMGEYKAMPDKAARGTVIEARLDKGRGPVANILVQDGTLRIGDVVVAGAVSGRVRALMNDRGERLREAGPSTPVEIQGLEDVPEPGDSLFVVEDSVKAHTIVSFRQQKLKDKQLALQSRVRLEAIAKPGGTEGPIELPLVLKADVQGSVEALTEQLKKIPQEKIRLRIIRSGVGAINEGDVLLAAASEGIVVGFNVRPERKAAEFAERDNIEVRLYTIIYDVVDDLTKALEGRLAPAFKEVVLGQAKVQDIFKISKIGTIAGCLVTEGKVTRQASVRLLRDNIVIHTGKVASLKRHKDDASEVKAGTECGIGIVDFNDVKPGDIIEFFVMEKYRESL